MAVPPDPPLVRPARRRLFRFRISLRGLMGVILIVAIALGTIAHQARVQRDGVAAILRSGGSVTYDWHYDPGGRFDLGRLPPAPRWLVAWLGPDYFGQVTSARFGKIPINDADLAALAGLTGLHELDLSSTAITDAGMVHLRGLVRLRALYLTETSVSSAGLGHLRGMTDLVILGLAQTRVADLNPIALRVDKLIWLNLAQTPMTDSGLTPLARATDLQFLFIQDTPITDAGLAHLPRTRQLYALLLDDTAITDSGIDGLPDLSRLGSINLARTKVSPERVARLRRQYPRVSVNQP